VFDIVVAACAIALVSPVMLIAALLTKIESPGPVLFVQERIGLNRRRSDRRSRQMRINLEERTGADRRARDNPGRPFRIYKFRTMVQNAEDAGPVLACENDPRITRFGRVMRKTRIDELPQFINVIKGDMSIIGPRPERSYFIDKMKQDVPEFTMRLVVKPGITGLAQVENGYTKTLDEMKRKLFYDLKYIADLSITQELKILLKTVYVVVTGKGAC
jgi:lipopolysaccharide/colanic/teichoic acid biosynthesis glycosyltransferase